MDTFTPEQIAVIRDRKLDPQSVETFHLSRAAVEMRFENPGERVDICPIVEQNDIYRLIVLPDGALLPIRK